MDITTDSKKILHVNKTFLEALQNCIRIFQHGYLVLLLGWKDVTFIAKF